MPHMNASDLQQIVEQLNSFIQIGGGRGRLGRGLQVFVVNLFYIIVIIFILYVVYVIVVKGYYRQFVNVTSQSWFKKEDLNAFIKEKDLFFNHMLELSNTQWKGMNPFGNANDIILSEDAIKINERTKDIMTIINTHPSYTIIPRKQDRLVEFMRRFYTYNVNTSRNSLKTTNDRPSALTREFREFSYHIEQIKNPRMDPGNLPKCKASVASQVINSEADLEICPAPPFMITNSDFQYYTKIYQDKNPTKQSPTELEVLNMYYYDNDYYWTKDLTTMLERLVPITLTKDELKKKTHYKSQQKAEIDVTLDLCKYLQSVVPATNIAYMFFIPTSINEHIALIEQMTKYSSIISSETIYHNKAYISASTANISSITKGSVRINDFVWYILEVMQPTIAFVNYSSSIDDNVLYQTPSGRTNVTSLINKYNALKNFADTMISSHASTNIIRDHLKAFITVYMSTPARKRTALFIKLPQSFPAQFLAEFRDMKSNKDKVEAFWKKVLPMFVWFEKHPIFTHIYFNTHLVEETQKAAYYEKVINLYRKMLLTKSNGKTLQNMKLPLTRDNLTSIMTNLTVNGANFKNIVTSIVILDLYMNGYRDEMIDMFKEQRMTKAEFRDKLWTKYAKGIIDKQLIEYYKRIFASSYMKNKFNKFKKLWGILGDYIKSAKKSVADNFKSTISKKDVEQQPVPPEDPKSVPSSGSEPAPP